MRVSGWEWTRRNCTVRKDHESWGWLTVRTPSMLFFFHPKTGNISSEGFLWVSSPFFFIYPQTHIIITPHPISFYTASACRHFIAAMWDMRGERGCRQCILGGGKRFGGGWQEKWTEVEGWIEIAGVWRASISLHQCQALNTAFRYYQEVISSPCLSVYQSLCLSPSFLLREIKESLSSAVALCFCFSLTGPLLLVHILFTMRLQGAASSLWL